MSSTSSKFFQIVVSHSHVRRALFQYTSTQEVVITIIRNCALWASSKYLGYVLTCDCELVGKIERKIDCTECRFFLFFECIIQLCYLCTVFSITNHASNGGRGLNIAVMNSKRLELKDFVSFDVYIENSVVMDMWINTTVKKNDIVLIFTFDEASRMLTESSRKLFYDYG